MNVDQITCPLCGTTFQPRGEEACAACPLHSDCAMVCCPSCGYTTLAPARSGLARGVTRIIGTLRRLTARDGATSTGLDSTLAGAPVGAEVRIVAIDELAAEHYDWLQAYGLVPGHCVRVLQQRPITIVQVEQAELSFEPSIAQAMRVEPAVRSQEAGGRRQESGAGRWPDEEILEQGAALLSQRGHREHRD